MNKQTKNKNVWLYSANYDGWWIYDKTSTERLNKMHKDYSIRKGLIEEKEPLYEKIIDSPIVQFNRKISQKSSDYVVYDEEKNDSSDLSDTYDSEKSTCIDYIIKVANNEYYIDLDRMKQINCSDTTRQRQIKKIEVPQKITDKNLVCYLRNKEKLNIKQS